MQSMPKASNAERLVSNWPPDPPRFTDDVRTRKRAFAVFTSPTQPEHSKPEMIEKDERSQLFRRARRVLPTSAHFNDGHRVIDMVLTHKDHRQDRRKYAVNTRFRQRFESELRNSGLEIEHESAEASPDGKTVITKIHATWTALCRQAEFENLQMPVKLSDVKPKPRSLTSWMLDKCAHWNPHRLPDELRIETPEFFTDAYERENEDSFLIGDMDTFFTQHQRIYLTWSIISGVQIKLKFKKRKPGASKKEKVDVLAKMQEDEDYAIRKPTEVEMREEASNIVYMLSQGIYTCAFPLHDCDVPTFTDTDEPDLTDMPANEWPLRAYLCRTWASWSQWCTYQPLEQIREYYGEKVGMYFAWLGFYTHMLVAPALLGVLIFIWGLVSAKDDQFKTWFCANHTQPFMFCRECASIGCDYTERSELCTYAHVSRVFDNIGATVFSVFMSIWVVVFLEMWKRYQSELCARWDVSDNELISEQVRPDYNLNVESTWVNPVTHEIEPHLEKRSVYQRLIGSCVTVFVLLLDLMRKVIGLQSQLIRFYSIFFMSIVLSLLTGVMIYKVSYGPNMWRKVFTKFDLKDSALQTTFSPELITSITASLLNCLCIAVMSKIYSKVCWALTRMEMPRTDTQFEYSFTYKMFMFQFCNFYGALFYLSFVRGQMASSNPLDYKRDIPNCQPTGCMLDVSIQLLIVMTGKQILNNGLELGIPLMKNACRRAAMSKHKGSELYRWNKDLQLQDPPPLNLFSDYLEMLIQYGFITMFVPAFPLAPLFALINNIVEIRLDAIKMLKETKRTLPVRAKDIGPWFNLLSIVSKVAVFTNAILIALTSGFIDKTVFVNVFQQIHPNSSLLDFYAKPFDTGLYCASDSPSVNYHNGQCYELMFLLKMSPLNKQELIAQLNGVNTTVNNENDTMLMATNGSMLNDDVLNVNNTNITAIQPTDKNAQVNITQLRESIASKQIQQFRFTRNRLITKCYIRSYMVSHDLSRNNEYYHVIMAKLAFIIVFEHFILLIQAFLAALIPDMPEYVRVRLQREEYLQREWFKQREENVDADDYESPSDPAPPPVPPPRTKRPSSVSETVPTNYPEPPRESIPRKPVFVPTSASHYDSTESIQIINPSLSTVDAVYPQTSTAAARKGGLVEMTNDKAELPPWDIRSFTNAASVRSRPRWIRDTHSMMTTKV